MNEYLSQGVAFFCLVALSLAVWRVLNWSANNVVLPMVNNHINFLNELAQSLKQQGEALKELLEKVQCSSPK